MSTPTRFDSKEAAIYTPDWQKQRDVNTWNNRGFQRINHQAPKEPWRCAKCNEPMPRGDSGIFCPDCRQKAA